MLASVSKCNDTDLLQQKKALLELAMERIEPVWTRSWFSSEVFYIIYSTNICQVIEYIYKANGSARHYQIDGKP